MHDRQSVLGGRPLDVRRRWPQPDEDRRDGCGYRQRRPDGKQVMTGTPQHGRRKPGTRERGIAGLAHEVANGPGQVTPV